MFFDFQDLLNILQVNQPKVSLLLTCNTNHCRSCDENSAELPSLVTNCWKQWLSRVVNSLNAPPKSVLNLFGRRASSAALNSLKIRRNKHHLNRHIDPQPSNSHIYRRTQVKRSPFCTLMRSHQRRQTQPVGRWGAYPTQQPSQCLFGCIFGKFHDHVTLCGYFVQPQAAGCHQVAGTWYTSAYQSGSCRKWNKEKKEESINFFFSSKIVLVIHQKTQKNIQSEWMWDEKRYKSLLEY
jgi:hypothetical protein